MPITHGSLFAGIGGFDLGFEWADIETIWDVEIDPYCQAVLRKNFPDTEIYSDVRKVGKHNLAPVDIISGGYPCQPFSVAGKRGGATDDRYLWPEMLRVINELDPRWVVAENVPNIDSMGYLDVAIDDLESIGYEVRTLEIPAAGVGAHHLRKRLFIISRAIRCGSDSRAKRTGYSAGTNVSRRSARTDLENTISHFDRPEIVRKEVNRQEAERSTSRIGGPSIEDVSNSNFTGSQGHGRQHQERHGSGERITGEGGWPIKGIWITEPDVGRVAHGIPRRVDRLRSLGNAVVPQIAEIIGREIVKSI